MHPSTIHTKQATQHFLCYKVKNKKHAIASEILDNFVL